jgi:hypothetical protein
VQLLPARATPEHYQQTADWEYNRPNKSATLHATTPSTSALNRKFYTRLNGRVSSAMKGLSEMYKPNFCSECGSRIERSRWHLWTSRRFCSDCAPRFRSSQLLLPVVAGAMLFAIGLVAGRTARPTPPPLIVERGELPLLSTPATKDKGQTTGAETEMSETATAPKAEPGYGPDGSATERPTDPNEVVSICGARTQKGTPCQRRVRGTGRCWQHKGMPAMIPLEKRVVTGD